MAAALKLPYSSTLPCLPSPCLVLPLPAQLAGLLHRNKEMDAAFEAYQKAVDFADPYFVS